MGDRPTFFTKYLKEQLHVNLHVTTIYMVLKLGVAYASDGNRLEVKPRTLTHQAFTPTKDGASSLEGL